MEKLKDFFYDKNDLVVALIIIALAGLLIAWRVNVIMDYPEIMAAQLEQEQQENGGADADNADRTDNGDSTSGTAIGNNGTNGGIVSGQPDATTPQPPATTQPTQTPAPGSTSGKPANSSSSFTVVIPSGSSGDKIAQLLIDVGALSSKSDFTAAVQAAGAETKLKAGTFKIPAGSSASEIVNIITK